MSDKRQMKMTDENDRKHDRTQCQKKMTESKCKIKMTDENNRSTCLIKRQMKMTDEKDKSTCLIKV